MSRNTLYGNATYLRRLLRTIESYGVHGAGTWLPRVKGPRPRTVIAQPDELTKLETQASAPLRLFIRLCSHLALRFTEAYELRHRDYNPADQTITVTVKGGKLRTMPLTPELDHELRAIHQPGQTSRVLETVAGHPLSPSALRKQWRALVKKTGVNQELIPHDLRRTTATAAYVLTHELRAVQTLLGHERLHTTAGYIAPLPTNELRQLLLSLRPPTERVQ
jgi:integrase